MQPPDLRPESSYVPAALAIETEVAAVAKHIDALEIKRVLPTLGQRNVGPFVFLDHMGLTNVEAGQGINVRPHPHIGLATLTYLFKGSVLHRDSLGSVQEIVPGEVNWMVAGGGIVHSERSVPGAPAGQLHGLQMWLALPLGLEDCAPSFEHFSSDDIPSLNVLGGRVRVVLGEYQGFHSPVAAPLGATYLDLDLPAGTSLSLPETEERAVYVIEGALDVGGHIVLPGRLAVLKPGSRGLYVAHQATRAAFLGGRTLEARRFIEWNFVSSSEEAIAAAKERWRRREFPLVPGDEVEFIPLPDGHP
jgi:redox-sensitive bicupin YhaK (pirin superfamily)